jgi:hypothetical protein
MWNERLFKSVFMGDFLAVVFWANWAKISKKEITCYDKGKS